jgi:hypothetical protein
MLRAIVTITLVWLNCRAASPEVRTPGEITGAALHAGALVTWGDQIIEWHLPTLRPRTLAASHVQRGEGGCIVEFGAGAWGIVTQEGTPFGDLVLRRAPGFVPEKMDTNVQMHDCAQATLVGQRGIVVVHRFAQVRFYRAPETPGNAWPYREIYSIYTPSRQGGLLITDIDGDGSDDIVVGNYWMRSPPDVATPWREFALDTWSETPDSAIMNFARMGRDLIIAQAQMPDARVSHLSPPADITQLWNELRLSGDLHLRYPHAIVIDRDDLIVAENGGPGSRVFLFRDSAPPELIATTEGVQNAFVVNGRVLAVGAHSIRWLPLQARK